MLGSVGQSPMRLHMLCSRVLREKVPVIPLKLLAVDLLSHICIKQRRRMLLGLPLPALRRRVSSMSPAPAGKTRLHALRWLPSGRWQRPLGKRTAG